MSPFNSVSGFCEIRGANVDILMIAMKKNGKKGGAPTPVRCQSSSKCPRSSFCRFVNPLTTRLPVVFNQEPPQENTPAEAS